MLQTFKLLDRSIFSSRLVICVLLRFIYPTGLSSLIIGCVCKLTLILVLVLVRSKVLPISGSIKSAIFYTSGVKIQSGIFLIQQFFSAV